MLLLRSVVESEMFAVLRPHNTNMQSMDALLGAELALAFSALEHSMLDITYAMVQHSFHNSLPIMFFVAAMVVL
jgi:hypothetical protein